MSGGAPSAGLIWAVTLGLGAATYLIRFSFLGLIGDRPLPPLLVRALGYVPVTVLPALVAPAIFTDAAGGPALDPGQVVPAVATVAVGILTRRMLDGLLAGVVVFAALRLLGA